MDWLITKAQQFCWMASRLLRLRFAIRARIPAKLFADGSDRRIILAPAHRSFLDPWFIAAALDRRQMRHLVPVRILATQTFERVAPLTSLIRLLYRVMGVIALPPRGEDRSLEEKTGPLVNALEAGDPVVIFPEGHVRRQGSAGAGTFQRGVVHVQRASGAPVVVIDIRFAARRGFRRPCTITASGPLNVPASLDLDAGAAWLAGQLVELDPDRPPGPPAPSAQPG